MAYDNLPDFLAHLQDDGELRRVSTEVDPRLEITEIVDRICKQPGGGPALMFEKVQGSPLPLVVNLLGTVRRISRALGVGSISELLDRLSGSLRPDAPESWFQKLKIGSAASVAPWKPQLIKAGMCQQVVKLGRDIDLRELPAIQAWPADSGRFLYAGTVLGKHPHTGERFIESIPMQVLDRDTLGVYWHPHHLAFQYFQEYRRLGTHLPLAVAFGGDPTWQFVAQAPIPPQIDPLVYGGCLRGKALDVVRGRQVDLEVPAGAEIVMEGFIDSQESPIAGGTFSHAAGHYASPLEVPVFRVTALTHRGNPVLVENVPGRPPMENSALWEVYTQLALPLLRHSSPEIVDVRLLHETANDQIAFVSIRKAYPQQARKVLHALWGQRFMMHCKLLIIVDEDVSLQNQTDVWHAVACNVHPSRDLQVGEGPSAPWDHSTPTPGIGSKLGLDATRKLSAEGHPREWPAALSMPNSVRELVSRRWLEYQIDRRPRA
jgi:4-hydroxy-3-polyprenylbenzoate decarboxylase